MKGLVKLGAKNLMRYKRRTIITAFAVAMGLMMFIMMDSLLLGISEESTINIMLYESGSGRVVTPAYWEDFESMPLQETLDPSVGEILDKGKITWTPRTEFSADIIFSGEPWNESGSLPILVSAIDPARDRHIFAIENTVTQGHYLSPGEEGVIIGQWLAEDMGAQVGYPIRLRVKTRFGSEEVMDLEVAGIMDSPDPYVNTGVVLMDIDVAGDYLEMDGLFTQAVVKLSSNPNPPRNSVMNLTALLSGTGAEFHSWEDWASDFIAIAAGKQTSAYSILFLVVLIAAIGISNTVLMSLYERTRELGMLRALGMTDWDLRRTFLIEAAGIGLIGAVIGMIWGGLANFYLVEIGIDYGDLLKDLKVGYRVTGIMHGIWIVKDYLIALFGGIIICTGISWFVTKRLVKMEITDCLRFN